MSNIFNRRPCRRHAASFAAVVGAFALVVATSAQGAVPESTPTGTTPPAIPEGIYLTPGMPLDQLVATGVREGFDAATVEQLWTDDGMTETLMMGVRLAAGGFTELYGYDGADPGPGLRGTYETVDSDTLVITDPQGTITFDFVLDGDELSLDFVDIDSPGAGPIDDIFLTTSYETAPFVLQDPAAVAPAGSRSFTSTTFVVPFQVTVPDWVDPEPATEELNFVTWEGTAVDRGVRFLVPVTVFEPGSGEASAPPGDYRSYVDFLTSQTSHGASLDDVIETTVDGREATFVTATTATSLNGSIGCQETSMAAEDCFGVQPDLVLRMAIIDTGSVPLIVWVRDIAGDGERTFEYETFDAMLASLTLPT